MASEMKRLALMLALASCTRTVETRSESAVQATVAVEERASSTLDEVVQTGPETITTTTEEWETPPLSLNSGQHLPSFDGPEQSAGPVSARGATPILPPQAHLVKRTVTIDQRGPILDAKRQTSTEASSATQTVKSEEKAATVTKTSYWPPWWLWVALAASLAGGVAVLRGWLKMPFGL